MVRIRRFSVIRTASVVALMYLIGIAIIGVPVFVVAAFFGATGSGGIGGGILGGAAVGIVLIGVVYAIVGWTITAIACLLYNAAASFTGGIEVQVDRPDTASPMPSMPDSVRSQQTG
jgi:hypothetical protein